MQAAARKARQRSSPPTSPQAARHTRATEGTAAPRARGAAAAPRAPQGNQRTAEQVGGETMEWLFIHICGSLFTASILAAPVIVNLLVEWAAGSNPQTD